MQGRRTSSRTTAAKKAADAAKKAADATKKAAAVAEGPKKRSCPSPDAPFPKIAKTGDSQPTAHPVSPGASDVSVLLLTRARFDLQKISSFPVQLANHSVTLSLPIIDNNSVKLINVECNFPYSSKEVC